MAWLPDGDNFSKISLFISTQLTNVADTDRQRNGQTLHDSIGRAYSSHRAAKTSSASCEFRFIRCFYVCISIQNILKGNIQPKFKGASVWPKSTAVITGVIFTCPGRAGPGRAGPVFRLDRRLTYFARLALRAAQHAVEPESRFTDGRTLDTSLKLTTSVTKLAWEGNREYSPRPRNRGIIRIVTNMYYLGKGITDTMPPKGY